MMSVNCQCGIYDHSYVVPSILWHHDDRLGTDMSRLGQGVIDARLRAAVLVAFGVATTHATS